MAKKAKVGIQPLDDRVLVQPEEAEQTTAGGIVLPDSAQDKPTRGKVVAIGTGKMTKSGERRDLSVKIGDLVLYGKYGGSDITVEGTEYKILRESDLLARIE